MDDGVVRTVKLGDQSRLSQDLTVRFSDNRGGLYEVESNSLLGYRIGKTATLWAGSCTIPSTRRDATPPPSIAPASR